MLSKHSDTHHGEGAVLEQYIEENIDWTIISFYWYLFGMVEGLLSKYFDHNKIYIVIKLQSVYK